MDNSVLNPAGSALFSDFGMFVKDLSEEDESMIAGGTGDDSKSKSKSKSESKSKSKKKYKHP